MISIPNDSLFAGSPPNLGRLSVATLRLTDPLAVLRSLDACRGAGWVQLTSAVVTVAGDRGVHEGTWVSGPPYTKEDPTTWGTILDAERVVGQSDGWVEVLHVRHGGSYWDLRWASIRATDAAQADPPGPTDAKLSIDAEPCLVFNDELVANCGASRLVYKTCWLQRAGDGAVRPWEPAASWFVGWKGGDQ